MRRDAIGSQLMDVRYKSHELEVMVGAQKQAYLQSQISADRDGCRIPLAVISKPCLIPQKFANSSHRR
ncbi:MAG: hypothetical protein VR74_01450 [Hyphomonas sp. BRH_c22]|uniref:hypothetical protein n=1 Tax=Hyphomonas sp. BRH_c22 TaxID=1629710 RepID=UPI0005F0D27C|nr:hypothetical protein [Hyphomonas sp. BRH_c22]KJS39617.1 MAG: hypothetical protein VR74_01450 [Hyphomonas sp. BRH_c22]